MQDLRAGSIVRPAPVLSPPCRRQRPFGIADMYCHYGSSLRSVPRHAGSPGGFPFFQPAAPLLVVVRYGPGRIPPYRRRALKHRRRALKRPVGVLLTSSDPAVVVPAFVTVVKN